MKDMTSIQDLIRDLGGVPQEPPQIIPAPKSKNTPGRKATPNAKRDRAVEAMTAKNNQIERIVNLTVSRSDQSLGEEDIKLAQALILCTLPHSPTKETKVTRRARLGDGSYVSVTFGAASEGVGLPYGADRKLLFWLIDRAIRNDNPFVAWASAKQYQEELGLAPGGATNRDLRQRFARIAGMSISIRRDGKDGTGQTNFFLVDRSYLPTSIIGIELEKQQSLPELADRFGLLLNASLFADIKKHKTVMPRRLWLEIKGPTAVQDLVTWLYYRCYAAATETIIPWNALTEQFPQDDSNPWRMKSHVRKAIAMLKKLWPGAVIEEAKSGILVGKASAGMLDDDPVRNRFRKLK